MEGLIFLCVAFFTGHAVPAHIVREPTDCSALDTLEHPRCDRLLAEALRKGLETSEGVKHYCDHIEFYPRCLRRHRNDYTFMHRCGEFGEQLSMPDSDKWFSLIAGLQEGFRSIVCGRTPTNFIQAINCYKQNASYVFHSCASEIPELYAYMFFEDPGASVDIHFSSYTYCAFLYHSADCIRQDVNAICGDKTRDLLDDAYRLLVQDVYSNAFDCGQFIGT